MRGTLRERLDNRGRNDDAVLIHQNERDTGSTTLTPYSPENGRVRPSADRVSFAGTYLRKNSFEAVPRKRTQRSRKRDKI